MDEVCINELWYVGEVRYVVDVLCGGCMYRRGVVCR